MISPVYRTIPSLQSEVPILLSIPHCGTQFPDELKNQYKSELIAAPDDTDWFVDQLYDFAASMGIGMIAASYSRWVIDLNRDPGSKPLYTDGRIITALCPATDFLGTSIYRDERKEVDAGEVERRVGRYYRPYHEEIQKQLDTFKQKFGKVLLWECHSIRQVVPTIYREKFPDLILGDADETSASPELIQTAMKHLHSASYTLSHNHPFKGGYITRHFGKPSENQHALQLEMSKVNYMDDTERKYDAARAGKMREVLKRTLGGLAEVLMK